MQRKLTVTIDERVYEGLRDVIGPRKISRFIEDLVRPHVIRKDIYSAYKEMAGDEVRESEALDWAEATLGDVNDRSICYLSGKTGYGYGRSTHHCEQKAADQSSWSDF